MCPEADYARALEQDNIPMNTKLSIQKRETRCDDHCLLATWSSAQAANLNARHNTKREAAAASKAVLSTRAHAS